jgi:hypothetical protein
MVLLYRSDVQFQFSRSPEGHSEDARLAVLRKAMPDTNPRLRQCHVTNRNAVIRTITFSVPSRSVALPRTIYELASRNPSPCARLGYICFRCPSGTRFCFEARPASELAGYFRGSLRDQSDCPWLEIPTGLIRLSLAGDSYEINRIVLRTRSVGGYAAIADAIGCPSILMNRIVAAVFLVAVSLSAQSQTRTASKPDTRLARVIDQTLKQGHDAILPPHISHLLGISPEEHEVPIKQFVQMGEPIRGFEVSGANHNNVVLFVENHGQNESTFYLTSARGILRKVLSVRQGVGYDRVPNKDDQAAFEKEKQLWIDRLTPKQP